MTYTMERVIYDNTSKYLEYVRTLSDDLQEFERTRPWGSAPADYGYTNEDVMRWHELYHCQMDGFGFYGGYADFAREDTYNEIAFEWGGEEHVKLYTADFETITDPNDCRVWAWCICDIDDVEQRLYGTTIQTFFDALRSLPDCRMYFHNLAFDGSFIMDYMLRNGYEWENDRFPRSDNTFTTIISDMNQVYSIRVNLGRGHTVTFWDSAKVIPMSVAAEAKAFGLPMSKGTIDYDAWRSPDHELTEEEKEYITGDVVIDALAMRQMLAQGMDKMTIGASSLKAYKQTVGGERGFRYHFPKITVEEDAFMRRAYRGGWVYVNPRYTGLTLGAGISFDVNSLYPSVMAGVEGELLPYGRPEWFYGSPFGRDAADQADKPLWIAQLRCTFRLREDGLPCLQMKGNLSFLPTEYVREAGNVVITVTSVDFELMRRMYSVEVREWMGGYAFSGSTTLYKTYIDMCTEGKTKATLEGNLGERTLWKLKQNNIYGKMATGMVVQSRKPIIDERTDVLRYVDLPAENREGVYLPAGCFITAWARFKTVTTAAACGDRFIYSDTDSVKVLGTDPIEGMWVDDVALGAWKDEGHFSRFKALRAKTYIADYGTPEEPDIEVHVAGLPKRCHEQVTFDNFELGAEYQGKLYQHRVRGGIVLIDGAFKIKG